MIATLFYFGVVGIVFNVWLALYAGKTKREIVVLPFMCFVGAAVGHWIGV